jgi:hypothetical protein
MEKKEKKERRHSPRSAGTGDLWRPAEAPPAGDSTQPTELGCMVIVSSWTRVLCESNADPPGPPGFAMGRRPVRDWFVLELPRRQLLRPTVSMWATSGMHLFPWELRPAWGGRRPAGGAHTIAATDQGNWHLTAAFTRINVKRCLSSYDRPGSHDRHEKVGGGERTRLSFAAAEL